MRNMSFSLTTQQMCARRTGWGHLEPGEPIQACVKCMGLKKGERIQKLGVIRIVSIRQEPLQSIDGEDVIREGFTDMTSEEFIAMFISHRGIGRADAVNRIEFEHIDNGHA